MTDYDLFPGATGPAEASLDNPVTLGVQWSVTGIPAAWLLGYRFWRADLTILGPVVSRTYQVVNPAVGSPVADTDAEFVLSGTGWQEVLLPAAVPVSVDVAYRSAAHFPTNYSSTAGYFASGPGVGGIVNGPLTAPDSTSVDQGSFNYGAANAFPDGSFNGGNYWITPILSDVDPDAGQTVELGQAVETDTAGTVASARAVILGQALELDSATGFTIGRAVVVGQAVAVDTADAVRPSRSLLLGQALEVDTGRTVSPVLGAESGEPIVPGVLTASATIAGTLSATSSVSGLEAGS